MRLEVVLENIRQYCSNDLLARTLHPQLNDINVLTSEWDVSEYVRSEAQDVSLIDKINVMLSYLHSGGVIIIDDNLSSSKNKPDFLSYLVRIRIITDEHVN